MNAIKTTVRAGRIEVEVPPEWSDGSEVEIHLQAPTGSGEDGPMSPEEITRILSAMEKVEPFDMTDAERADLDAWERKVNDYSIANMDKGIEGVFR